MRKAVVATPQVDMPYTREARFEETSNSTLWVFGTIHTRGSPWIPGR